MWDLNDQHGNYLPDKLSIHTFPESKQDHKQPSLNCATTIDCGTLTVLAHKMSPSFLAILTQYYLSERKGRKMIYAYKLLTWWFSVDVKVECKGCKPTRRKGQNPTRPSMRKAFHRARELFTHWRGLWKADATFTGPANCEAALILASHVYTNGCNGYFINWCQWRKYARKNGHR